MFVWLTVPHRYNLSKTSYHSLIGPQCSELMFWSSHTVRELQACACQLNACHLFNTLLVIMRGTLEKYDWNEDAVLSQNWRVTANLQGNKDTQFFQHLYLETEVVTQLSKMLRSDWSMMAPLCQTFYIMNINCISYIQSGKTNVQWAHFNNICFKWPMRLDESMKYEVYGIKWRELKLVKVLFKLIT